jgi:hypothetical protein
MKTLLLTALIIILGASTPALAQSAQAVQARAAEATRVLQDLPQIVNKDNHRAIGFESVEEAQAGKLGEPISVYMIRLDTLQKYSGEDAGKLLVDAQRVVYPVEVAGQVRTTVELSAVGGRWQMSRIGGAQKIRALDKNRSAAMRTAGMLRSDFFEVRIPALNRSFLGHHDAAGLMLTPLTDDASLKLQAGQPELASQVLARLVPEAQATPINKP